MECSSKKSELVGVIKKQLPELYAEAGRDGSHTIEHVLSVARYAHLLAVVEEIDPELVELAALLHDIGFRPDQPQTWNRHGQIASGLIQSSRGLSTSISELMKLPPKEYYLLLAAIEQHNEGVKSSHSSSLAKVLRDADRLDSLGLHGWQRIEAAREFYKVPISYPTDAVLSELLQNGWLKNSSLGTVSGNHAVKLLSYPNWMETNLGKELAQILVQTTRKKIRVAAGELGRAEDWDEFVQKYDKQWGHTNKF